MLLFSRLILFYLPLGMNVFSTSEAVTESPLGLLRIRVAGWRLEEIGFVDSPAFPRSDTSVYLERVIEQLSRYFDDPRFEFSLDLSSGGTPFQRRVWEALRRIPSGDVRTYGELAASLGSSPRAVGNACRRNPVPIVVPCHRVVSASGVGGYAGETTGRLLRVKRWLLDHERAAG